VLEWILVIWFSGEPEVTRVYPTERACHMAGHIQIERIEEALGRPAYYTCRSRRIL
jgi:hypothetical protein